MINLHVTRQRRGSHRGWCQNKLGNYIKSNMLGFSLGHSRSMGMWDSYFYMSITNSPLEFGINILYEITVITIKSTEIPVETIGHSFCDGSHSCKDSLYTNWMPSQFNSSVYKMIWGHSIACILDIEERCFEKEEKKDIDPWPDDTSRVQPQDGQWVQRQPYRNLWPFPPGPFTTALLTTFLWNHFCMHMFPHVVHQHT